MARDYYYDNMSLEASSHAIRLLQFRLPDSLHLPDELRCTTVRVSLNIDPIPAYCAVSCAWGDATTPSTIFLDGHKVRVPRSTFEALQTLCFHKSKVTDRDRRPSRRRVQVVNFWIDAICINQSDVSERNQQVSIMSEIYARAEEVPVWLGKGAGQEKQTFELIDRLLRSSRRLIEFYSDGQTDQHFNPAGTAGVKADTTAVFCHHPNEAAANDPPKSPDDNRLYLDAAQWHLLYALYQCSWFTRLWVVQELVLAKTGRCTVYWGTERIDVRRITLAARLLIYGDATSYGGKLPRGALSAHVLHDLNNAELWGHCTLGDLLLLLGRFDCSEPRDKVYGLLGLLRQSQRKMLEKYAPI